MFANICTAHNTGLKYAGKSNEKARGRRAINCSQEVNRDEHYPRFYFLFPEKASICYRRSLMATSKLQRQVSERLSFQFSQFTIRENYRPAWCLSSDFQRLELDFFIDELAVAIEVQGNQHYAFTPIFHGTYEAFEKQQERDAEKRICCRDYGVQLFEIYDDTSMASVVDQIETLARFEPSKPTITQPTPPAWREERKAAERELDSPPIRPKKKLVTVLLSQVTELRGKRTTMGVKQFRHEHERLFRMMRKLIQEHGLVRFQTIDSTGTDRLFLVMQKNARYIAELERTSRREQHKLQERINRKKKEKRRIKSAEEWARYESALNELRGISDAGGNDAD